LIPPGKPGIPYDDTAMKKLLNDKYFAWVAVCAWCGVIFLFSAIPNLRIEELGSWDFVLRKLAHFLEFAVLAVLLLRAFEKTAGPGVARQRAWSGFLSAVYAVSDEYHQYFVPGRYTSLRDIILDSCGAAAGIVIYVIISGKKGKSDTGGGIETIK
jgi:VanZ family protein